VPCVTTQNLQVVRTDADRGLIMIKGAVPGSKGGWVTVKDAVKKPEAKDAAEAASGRRGCIRLAAQAAEQAALEAAAPTAAAPKSQ
jgi:large subunit ribosomal protein L3